jgi:hypothetical protein
MHTQLDGPKSRSKLMPADGMPVAIEISKRELRHVQLATRKSLYRFSIPQHMSRPKFLHHWQSLIPGARIDVAIDFGPVHRLELVRRGRKDLVDLVMTDAVEKVFLHCLSQILRAQARRSYKVWGGRHRKAMNSPVTSVTGLGAYRRTIVA